MRFAANRLLRLPAVVLPVAFLVAVPAAEPLVTWTNAERNDDGILEARVTAPAEVMIAAESSSFGKGLKAAKDAVRAITGNSVSLYPVTGGEHPDESIEAGIQKEQYAEIGFTVNGLPEGATLRITGLSYEFRPNGTRGAQVSGALASQAWIDGTLVGEMAEHEPYAPGSNAAENLSIELKNGDEFSGRVYFARFDSQPKKEGQKTQDFHRAIRLGNVIVTGSIEGASSPVVRTDLPKDVHAALEKHCFACHGPEKQKAKIRFDTLSSDFIRDRAAAETWHDALDVVSIGEMPPEDEPELSSAERTALTGWIRTSLDEAIAALQGKASGVVLRRLNNAEYRHTLTDLLGVEGDYGSELPADSASEDGFLNNGAALGMSAMQLETYLESARRALGRALVEGEPPERTREVFEKTDKINKLKTGEPSERLGRVNYFVARIDDVPFSGDFTIRVKARAEDTDGGMRPVLGVEYGSQVTGAIAFWKEVGSQEVTGESRVYEFRGRVEDFPTVPIQGDKYQQRILISNALDDGEEPPKPVKIEIEDPKSKDKKKKKKKTITRIPEDPDFPKIVIESVEFVGHDYETWPPESHRRILFEVENEGSPEYVREVLDRFLFRAWRRPPTNAELDRYAAHFEAVSARSESFIDAIRETLAVILASSKFLYLVEPHPKTEEARPLDDFELASRLSYLLWSSMPDDRLLQLAASGELKANLTEEVDRLLADPKSQRFIEQFTNQWLDLGGLERVAVNPQYYPDFDEGLKADMIGETQAFFAEILRNDLSALQFLDADWTMANLLLAKHYGFEGPKSETFERVPLEGTGRTGGLLGHASMHLANSDGEDSHPIKRAVWIRERLLHDPPLPPPPNVPALNTTDPDFAKKSIREQLEIHRADPACGDCHRGIDPWGIAMDHYDAVGLYRDAIRRPSSKRGQFDKVPVDARDTLPGGTEIDGIENLKRYLLEDRREQFAHALVAKLMTYALGRSLELPDEPVIRELAENFEADGYRLSALLKEIVNSEPFLSR